MNTETPFPNRRWGFCANVVDLLRSQNGKKEKNTRGSYKKKAG